MKTYYIANGNIKTTNCKITEKWIYTKNSAYRNYIGKTYKNKKSAIRSLVKNYRDMAKQLTIDSIEKQKQADSLNRKANKLLKRVK